MRTEDLKDLLEALTTAKDAEVTESLNKNQKKNLESLTAIKIAEKLASEDAATCNSAESANAETVRHYQQPNTTAPTLLSIYLRPYL